MRSWFARLTLGLHVLVIGAGVLIGGASFAGTVPSGLRVYPAQIQLDNARDMQRVVVTTTREDGVTVDLTEKVSVVADPPELATWREDFKLAPGADGQGQLVVEFGGERAYVPLTVGNAATDPPISFRHDVEPVLMRAGCNSGACHGSAQGKNGFRLSLFGFDPGMDYLNLTREVRGRRLNVAKPEESLIILKPTGGVDHEGGTRFDDDAPMYQTLKRWVAEGAQNDAGDVPTLTGIEILPRQYVLEGKGATQRFLVQARYSDGTDRDVTDLSILSSEDDAILEVGESGIAAAGERGEVYVMARYGSFAVISQVISIPADAQLSWPEIAPRNYIDELVYDKLRKLRIAPAETASDEAFVRRAFLDILGVLPTVEETREFLADEDAEKRSKLADRLLERPEFSELWTMKWAEVLRVRSSNSLDTKGMYRYNDWLRHAISSNTPMDQIVRELVTAEGGNFDEPAANFYLVESEPAQMAENVAQVFMGIQIKCAQCHNHPFERWTMDDYYSFAAFFAQVGRKSSSDSREAIIYNRGSGDVKNLKNGQVMAPKFLGGETPELNGRDRREVLAEWLASEKNPWFAKNIANRVWAQFFGRGIIDPPDDVRVSNPPSNAALLDELGKRLVSYNYDLRRLIRDICNSNTYRMSTQPRDPAVHDSENFAVAQVRRLPSEMLLDAICRVTGTKVKFASLPLGARAIEIADGLSGNYFLEVFGRPTRETACTCERRNEPTLAQTLHLINGDTISSALRAEDGRLAKFISEETPTETIIDNLYLAAYSRPPAEEEKLALVDYISQTDDRKTALEDVFWSVLNSKEFVFNH